MNIIIIGPMGCGKTKVGRALAKSLGYGFVDLDKYIESTEGQTISEIFKEHGENHFRQCETQALYDCQQLQNTVIATGGGIVTRKENMKLMQKIGTTLYLNVKWEILAERILKKDNRPLLNVENPEQRALEIFQNRKEKYESADTTITIEQEQPVAETVSMVIASL